MENVKKAPTHKDEAGPAKQPHEASHTAVIKSQVLAKIGRPPHLRRVEVCKPHHGKCRVNIWEQPEPQKNIAVTPGPRIGLSYYLTVSDTGAIIHSNPPLPKAGSLGQQRARTVSARQRRGNRGRRREAALSPGQEDRGNKSLSCQDRVSAG